MSPTFQRLDPFAVCMLCAVIIGAGAGVEWLSIGDELVIRRLVIIPVMVVSALGWLASKTPMTLWFFYLVCGVLCWSLGTALVNPNVALLYLIMFVLPVIARSLLGILTHLWNVVDESVSS